MKTKKAPGSSSRNLYKKLSINELTPAQRRRVKKRINQDKKKGG